MSTIQCIQALLANNNNVEQAACHIESGRATRTGPSVSCGDAGSNNPHRGGAQPVPMSRRASGDDGSYCVMVGTRDAPPLERRQSKVRRTASTSRAFGNDDDDVEIIGSKFAPGRGGGMPRSASMEAPAASNSGASRAATPPPPPAMPSHNFMAEGREDTAGLAAKFASNKWQGYEKAVVHHLVCDPVTWVWPMYVGSVHGPILKQLCDSLSGRWKRSMSACINQMKDQYANELVDLANGVPAPDTYRKAFRPGETDLHLATAYLDRHTGNASSASETASGPSQPAAPAACGAGASRGFQPEGRPPRAPPPSSQPSRGSQATAGASTGAAASRRSASDAAVLHGKTVAEVLKLMQAGRRIILQTSQARAGVFELLQSEHCPLHIGITYNLNAGLKARLPQRVQAVNLESSAKEDVSNISHVLLVVEEKPMVMGPGSWVVCKYYK